MDPEDWLVLSPCLWLPYVKMQFKVDVSVYCCERWLHSPRQAHSGIVLCGTPKLCYTQTPQLLDETRKQKLPDIACTFFVPKILCNTSGLLLDGYQTPINLIVRAFVSPVYGFFSLSLLTFLQHGLMQGPVTLQVRSIDLGRISKSEDKNREVPGMSP